MRFRMKNGKLATNAKQDIEVAGDHGQTQKNREYLRKYYQDGSKVKDKKH